MGCDHTEDPSERCGLHHPTETRNIPGTYDCCCGGPWLADADRCSSGAIEGEADKTYLEYLLVVQRALRSDRDALKAAVERVRELHKPRRPPEDHSWVSGGHTPHCEGCATGDPYMDQDWPCDTIRALDDPVNAET